MPKTSGPYEKGLLAFSSILAAGLSAYLVYDGQQMVEGLAPPMASPKAEFNPPAIAQVQAAQATLGEKFVWTSPTLKGKAVPLNKSVLLLQKGDELFDLQVPTPQLRPPMSNEYLLANRLPYIVSPNVGQLDPDGDSFSNEEEFAQKTNPMDPASHPPLTQKLVFKQRIAHDYIVKLNGTSAPFQVQRVKPEPKASKFVQVQEEFVFEKGAKPRFKALGFESKTAKDPKTNADVDASELKVLDSESGKEIVLVKGKELNLATYEVEFELRTAEAKTLRVKDQGTFEIPGAEGSFKVIAIGEAEAKIVPVKGNQPSGQEILVKKS